MNADEPQGSVSLNAGYSARWQASHRTAWLIVTHRRVGGWHGGFRQRAKTLIEGAGQKIAEQPGALLQGEGPCLQHDSVLRTSLHSKCSTWLKSACPGRTLPLRRLDEFPSLFEERQAGWRTTPLCRGFAAFPRLLQIPHQATLSRWRRRIGAWCWRPGRIRPRKRWKSCIRTIDILFSRLMIEFPDEKRIVH